MTNQSKPTTGELTKKIRSIVANSIKVKRERDECDIEIESLLKDFETSIRESCISEINKQFSKQTNLFDGKYGLEASRDVLEFHTKLVSSLNK